MTSNQPVLGTVQIYHDQVLGVGSYGKVCKAKCGQLPCAAKLLHDTMFESGDPGVGKFAERFDQECQFLSSIKHPNIIQYLGAVRNSRSQRLTLLMELMDESLTKFLERSSVCLAYHIQLNICHDVAMALSYLHSNSITHRDLSANNVLLIGNGCRAKVSDFGMSKLSDVNPRWTQLTVCPGATVYMPPEALTTPPNYCSKLDCFSHGVLTIQVITRNFPDPGDAHEVIEDSNYPGRSLILQVPETERCKKDIDLIEPSHPLLPMALHCLHSRATERPPASELCERLAALKNGRRYIQSMEQSRDLLLCIGRLQTQIVHKDEIIRQERLDHDYEIRQKSDLILKQQREITRRDKVLCDHVVQLCKERSDYEQEIRHKDEVIDSLRNEIAQKNALLRDSAVQLQKERWDCEKELRQKDSLINSQLTEIARKNVILRDRTVQLHKEKSSHEIELEQKDELIASQRTEIAHKNVLLRDSAVRLHKERSDNDMKLEENNAIIKSQENEIALKNALLRDRAVEFHTVRSAHEWKLEHNCIAIATLQDELAQKSRALCDNTIQLCKERSDHEAELKEKKACIRKQQDELDLLHEQIEHLRTTHELEKEEGPRTKPGPSQKNDLAQKSKHSLVKPASVANTSEHENKKQAEATSCDLLASHDQAVKVFNNQEQKLKTN